MYHWHSMINFTARFIRMFVSNPIYLPAKISSNNRTNTEKSERISCELRRLEKGKNLLRKYVHITGGNIHQLYKLSIF